MRLNNSQLYLILDKQACGLRNLKTMVKEALEGGVDIIQYRDKVSTSKQMIKETILLLKIARCYRLPLVINDRLDVALSTNADGIHLGQDDMPVAQARKVLGKKKIIGLSCHSLDDVKKAKKEKLDYLGFGPIFKTATKPKIHPVGPQAFRMAQRLSPKPVFAIGGITETNLSGITAQNPLRIAVCRELCLAKDIKKKTESLKKKLKQCTKS